MGTLWQQWKLKAARLIIFLVDAGAISSILEEKSKWHTSFHLFLKGISRRATTGESWGLDS